MWRAASAAHSLQLALFSFVCGSFGVLVADPCGRLLSCGPVAASLIAVVAVIVTLGVDDVL